MQRRLPGGRIERATQRFAIIGHDIVFQRCANSVEPTLNARQERRRVESSEHPTERVVRGRAMRQVQIAAEEGQLRFGIVGDFDPAIGTRHGAA